MNKAVHRISIWRGYIWNIGYRPALGSYEKRKLGIFNFMNFLGVLAGILIPRCRFGHQSSSSAADCLGRRLVFLPLSA